MIYADNAATTRMCRMAINTMLHFMETEYGNPSSLHTMGQMAAEGLHKAREAMAFRLGCPPRGITFTSGGSEANNQAILSASAAGKAQGKKILYPQHLNIMPCYIRCKSWRARALR